MRKNSKGNLIYEKIIAVPNFDMAGKLIDIDIILQDFTENYTVKNMIKRAKFKEKEASIIDRETELPNHLALNEMLKKQEHAHVLYISLDQFSNIVFFYNQATVLLILIEVGKTINLFIENIFPISFALFLYFTYKKINFVYILKAKVLKQALNACLRILHLAL